MKRLYNLWRKRLMLRWLLKRERGLLAQPNRTTLEMAEAILLAGHRIAVLRREIKALGGYP